MKQIVHFGLYDNFTELEYADYAAVSGTTYQVVRDDLIEYLKGEISRVKENLHLDWAAPLLEYNETILKSVEAATSITDLQKNEHIHYEVIELLGDFDEHPSDLG